MKPDSLRSRTRKDRLAELPINAAKQYRPGASFTAPDLYAADRRICEYSKGGAGGMCRKVFVKDPNRVPCARERTGRMLPND